MRLILTTSILTLLAQPAWAQTVYYCSMTNLVEIDRQISRYQPERFKMSVTEEYVHFGSGGYLDGGFMHVREKKQDGGFRAEKRPLGTPMAVALFEPPDFYYSYLAISAVSFHATCDRF